MHVETVFKSSGPQVNTGLLQQVKFRGWQQLNQHTVKGTC